MPKNKLYYVKLHEKKIHLKYNTTGFYLETKRWEPLSYEMYSGSENVKGPAKNQKVTKVRKTRNKDQIVLPVSHILNQVCHQPVPLKGQNRILYKTCSHQQECYERRGPGVKEISTKDKWVKICNYSCFITQKLRRELIIYYGLVWGRKKIRGGMVLAKEKCGLYDCFPVVLQFSNHGRVFSEGIALVCRAGCRGLSALTRVQFPRFWSNWGRWRNA